MVSYTINHHCKACGLCDILSLGKISFHDVDKITFREASYAAERDTLLAQASRNLGLLESAYNEVKVLLQRVVHTGATEAQVRRIEVECFVKAMEVIE